MIDPKILDFNKEQLVFWLRHMAGSSNPEYFNAKKTGGMKLQQIPEEYAELLLLLKQFGAENYLALGVGNGGSFAMECLFMSQTLKFAIAVDNLAYGPLIQQNENEIKEFISETKQFCDPAARIIFVNKPTNLFFQELDQVLALNGPFSADPILFDVAFIDADHSYEGVRSDYYNALGFVRKTGLIIFHDINSAACPGIKRIWADVKQGRWSREIIHSDTCGIGIIQI